MANRTFKLRTLLGGDGICFKNGASWSARELTGPHLRGPFGDFLSVLVAQDDDHGRHVHCGRARVAHVALNLEDVLAPAIGPAIAHALELEPLGASLHAEHRVQMRGTGKDRHRGLGRQEEQAEHTKDDHTENAPADRDHGRLLFRAPRLGGRQRFAESLGGQGCISRIRAIVDSRERGVERGIVVRERRPTQRSLIGRWGDVGWRSHLGRRRGLRRLRLAHEFAEQPPFGPGFGFRRRGRHHVRRLAGRRITCTGIRTWLS